MKYMLALLFLIYDSSYAEPMKGFGARYYDKDTENYSETRRTNKDLIPDIVISNNKYKLESSSLKRIAKDTGVTVNKDNQATWICLKYNGINYWFISDNEMGGGYLTTIAIAKDGLDCKPYDGEIIVEVKNTPMLETSKRKVSCYFSHEPTKDIIMYYKELKRSDEYTQGNSIQYYLEGEDIKGVFISQGTTN